MRRSTATQDRSYRSSKRRSSPRSPKGKSDKRENFYCDYCKQQFLSKSVYQDHCKSEFHKDKVSFIMKATENNTWLCHSCEKGFDAKVTLDQHCLMLRHQALYRVEGMPMPGQVAIFEVDDKREEKSDLPGKESQDGRRNSTSGNKYFCFVCDVDCLNSSNHKIHLESWRHRAAADRLKETKEEKEEKQNKRNSLSGLELNGKSPNCHMCNVIFETEKSYLNHLEESRHVKKIALMRSPYNCSVCKIKIEKQSAFNAHLASHGHIERAAKDKPKDKDDVGKFKKAFQKSKGRATSPDAQSSRGRSASGTQDGDDLRVQLTKEKELSRYSRSPAPPQITKKVEEGPTLVDYRHDSSATFATSEADIANLRGQLMKEREEEWAKYKKLEEDYRRLCVDEEYIRRRIPFYEETDPRRLEDTAVLLKIQKSLTDINQELIFRDKMIQEKENFILGNTLNDDKQSSETKPPIDNRPKEQQVNVANDDVYYKSNQNKAANDPIYPEQPKQNIKAETKPAKKVKQEEKTPKKEKEHKKERSSNKRSSIPKENAVEAITDKEEYLYLLISDTLRKEREKIVKRLTPELDHLDATTRNRIIKTVLDRETDSESAVASEKERHKKHSKHKRHSRSKERQVSLADELQEAARRMINDQNGARPDPSVLLEQERKKLFGKDNMGRSTKKRHRSQSSDDSSDSSDSSDDKRSRRRTRRKRKSDKYDDESIRKSKKEGYPTTPSANIATGASQASILNPPMAYQAANALTAHSVMASRAGMMGLPGNPLAGYPTGLPPSVYPHGMFPPSHQLPPVAMPPSVHAPTSSDPIMAHKQIDLIETISTIKPQVSREDPYENLPPAQESNVPQQGSVLSAEGTPSRHALAGKRSFHVPSQEPKGSPARLQHEQLHDILASGVLDKIGAGSNLNVVDLLREQLANLDKSRAPPTPESNQDNGGLFPSAKSINPPSSNAPALDNPTPIKSILKKRTTSGDESAKDQSTDDVKVIASLPSESVSSSIAELPNFSALNDVVSSLTSGSNQNSYDRSHDKYSIPHRSQPPIPEDAHSRYAAAPRHGDELRRDPPYEGPPRDLPEKSFYDRSSDHISPPTGWNDDVRSAEYDSYRRLDAREPTYPESERPDRYDRSSDLRSGPYSSYPSESSARYDEPMHRDVPEYRRRDSGELPVIPLRPRGGYDTGRRSFPSETSPPHDRRYGAPPPDRRGIPPHGYGPPPRRGRPR